MDTVWNVYNSTNEQITVSGVTWEPYQVRGVVRLTGELKNIISTGKLVALAVKTYDIEENRIIAAMDTLAQIDELSAVAFDPFIKLNVPVNTVPPSITGDAVVGEVLTYVAGTWENADTVGFAWFKDGVELGNTETTYEIQFEDLGSNIYVQETATNLDGTAIQNSNAIDNIEAIYSIRDDDGNTVSSMPSESTLQVYVEVTNQSGDILLRYPYIVNWVSTQTDYATIDSSGLISSTDTEGTTIIQAYDNQNELLVSDRLAVIIP